MINAVTKASQFWIRKKFFLIKINALSMRRGWEVYIQVCSACHTTGSYFFNLIEETHTYDEVKKIAAEYQVLDDQPSETGEYLMRKAHCFDEIPAPYKNVTEAQYKNNGRYPITFRSLTLSLNNGMVI